MRGLFVDATEELEAVFRRVVRPDDPPVDVQVTPHVAPSDLPRLLAGYQVVLVDRSFMPTDAVRGCTDLRHIVFLGTGASSYMNPAELAALGVTVHTIRGYGDTAVAEHAIALMWAAARDLAAMDRAIRVHDWPRTEGVQLTGKTIGLLGFGGIAAEVARLAGGMGMRVLAWNRSPKTAPGVRFVDLDTLLGESHVLSLHLLLTEATRGMLSAERIARMRPGAILVNTARGALVDEAAMLAALRSGQLRHAALDVFEQEPLPHGHALATLPNVTLSAHSAFRTPEASETLVRRALDIAKRLATE
ncbi:3-phosphoglycerate dehydrogenase [Rhodovastum atsumiense]|uniref:3-phosphoglycerate dehydrogenase n=1 Tax=Rhodovastum atsumiense TaxID=504468 RepID=A0A5M6ISD4_9PROT|nr:NAD(P)-dependent oxidoreductase [Rhodovastum atsumiense]KAA5610478.1 3-phosphoglycerate dehydrogenase [Rhodovastum atsumiense]CAH2600463.1 3-phosphoglycerate dehydrogenase [Rhodovastum atsumiense]